MLDDDTGEAGERTRPTLLLLAEGDDVVIAACDLEPGLHLTSNGEQVIVTERIRLGHKVAAKDIPIGQAVRRCGVPIGLTTAAVGLGSWVHTHNLASGYVATFARRGGRR
jgi:altronate hydrolase